MAIPGIFGDCIASLPSVKALGGGHYAIGFRPGPFHGRESMEGARFEAIRPLLEEQPYIHGVKWIGENFSGVTHDFSTWRRVWVKGESLLDAQARYLGVKVSTESWLTVRNPNTEVADRIIVARSARYHNWAFPWPQIVAQHRERMLFVGLEKEHEEFCKLVGPVEYFPTKDLLEVAQAIAGSSLLISNQTAACWIGLGLGHPLIQEQWEGSLDSVIPRPNAQYCLSAAMPRISAAPGKVVIANGLQQAKPMPTVTICFPYFAGDLPQARTLAEHIRDLGGVEGFQCLMVCPQGTSTAGVLEPLQQAFGSVEQHSYAPRLKGWPQGPNEMFAETAMLIARDARFRDFLWLETDVVLLPGWAQQAERGYRTCGLPVMGVAVDTVALDSRQAVGRHVVGVAFYPKNFAQICPLVRSIVAMNEEYVRQRAVPMAFDALFGPYTIPRNAETRLIQHFWRSGEFREEGGQIIAGKTVSPGVENVVNPDAVILHGCKDGTLLEIIRRRAGLERSADAIDHTDRKQEEVLLERIDTTLRPELATAPRLANALKSTKAPKPPRPGDPVNPFVRGTPEDARWRELRSETLKTGGFAKVRKYAKSNLKLNTFGVTADRLAEICVNEEKKRGKEEWTKQLPKEPPPPAPPQSIAGWQETKPPEGGDAISEAMREKMIKMRRERGMPVGV